ncbi:hypothetical protein JWH11_09825 [Xanthomonas melonis]|uniref:Uncharacterized protein n=1 Tax=Xanthomonas melonis TaxID=56456 RepID=A0A2S7DEU2_9XANT|nr:hypothetical protein [Xanthomonas melonis]MCC4600205.1 hypothetical protein [Xanthomonas melonis]MCD0258597.1 hypothetical protein [Xanthomonas melonis]MCD0266723.1 hypothetical protein [Xanthomonas melonis]MCD0280185.1 hypothetical protein [Xanthomonas melonis]PPU72337.1 hypothetical protein XmelCFBP4644_12795 [Xanthomonas melonis]
MDEYQHTVLSRGGYRVVAITRDEVYAPDAVVAYAVVTDAGTRITPDLSLDQARLWVDSLVESESGGRRADPIEHKPGVRR